MAVETAANPNVLMDALRVPVLAGGDDGLSEPDHHGEGGFSESGESEDLGAGRGGGATSPAWLQHVLRTMADAHRDMALKVGVQNQNKRNLASVRIEEFNGGSGVSVHSYRMWKKSVLATSRLYKLTEQELALVIYTQVKGKAKNMLDIFEIDDLERPDGLDMVWKILDQAHENMEHERADEAYANWEQARRRHGQSMDEWISFVKKVRLEMEAHDPSLVISDRQMASKMLRGAGLPTENGLRFCLTAEAGTTPSEWKRCCA